MSKKENSRAKKIELVFGAYPKAEEFHFTSDDQAFSEKSDAVNHSKNLEDKKVETINRSSLKIKEISESGDVSQTIQTTGDSKADRAELAERYTALIGKKPAHNAGVAKLQAAIAEAEAALKEKQGNEPIKHIATQEDLDTNPDLIEEGVQVGDEIEIPAE